MMKNGGYQFVSVGHNNPRGRWHIGTHGHMHYEMIIVTGGHEEVEVPGVKLTARVGDVILFKPRVAHEEWSENSDPLQTYFISFITDVEDSEWPLQLVDTEGRIRLLASWLHSERDSHGAAAQAAQAGFMNALMAEYVHLIHHCENPLVASVRAFVRQNIGTALTLEMLAQHGGMSKFHFIRKYRELSGRSPMDDVRAIRVGYARDMILTSNLPLKAIAPLAGLGDEISLYRLFRRYLKMTPGQLRRTVRV